MWYDISLWKHIPEVSLNPKKTYEYKYEGKVHFGLGMQNLAESGVRMTCTVKIIGVSAQTFILQVKIVIEGNAIQT